MKLRRLQTPFWIFRMSDNATVAQESWLSLSHVSVILLAIYIAMKAVIFGGNLLTVATICVDRALHTPPYIFTALLAGADLVIGLSAVYDVMVLAAPDLVPSLSCPFNFLVIAAIVQAAQCTVLIALDRTLDIKYPLHYPLWMTATRTAAVVALSVVASLTYAAVIVNQVAWSPATCDIWTNTETHDRVLKELVPVCFFVPVSGCLYVHILTIARRQRAAIAKMHKIHPRTDNRQLELHITGKSKAADRKPATAHGAGAQRPSKSVLMQKRIHGSRMPQGSSSARATPRAFKANDAASLYFRQSAPKQLSHNNSEKEGGSSRLSPSISATAHLPFPCDGSRRDELQRDSRSGTAVINNRNHILTPVQSPIATSSCLSSIQGCSLYEAASVTTEVDKARKRDAERKCDDQSFTINCSSRSDRMYTTTAATTTLCRRKIEDTPVFMIQVAERKLSHPAGSAFVEGPVNHDVKKTGDNTVMESTPEIKMASSASKINTLQSKKTSVRGHHMWMLPGLMENKTSSTIHLGRRSPRNSILAASEMHSETVASAADAAFDLPSLQFAGGKDGLSASPPTSLVVPEMTSELQASSLSIVTGRTQLTLAQTSAPLVSSAAWRSCRMFFLVWGIYFLTIIPSVVFAVILLTSSVSREQTNFMVRLDGIFVYINSGINVFIYAWKDRRLRKSLWLALKCRWHNI